MQLTIYLELHNKVTSSPPKRCNWNWKWERTWNALENALKIGLKYANGCKIWPNKNLKYEWESKWKNNKCVYNKVFINKGALDDAIQIAPDNHLEWHLKVNFNIYIYKYAQEGAPDLY